MESHTLTSEVPPDRVGREEPPSAPSLFVILDCEDLAGGSTAHPLGRELDVVVVGRGPVRAATVTAAVLRLDLPDRQASRDHARFFRRGTSWLVEDLEAKNGTFLDGRRIQAPVPLRDGAIIEIGHTFLLFRAAAPVTVANASPTPGLDTRRPELALAFADLARIARTGSRVTLLGETGVGKEVVAHAYHLLTGRAGSFVPVNCAALPPTLLEATLFGHKRGAFSGATGENPGLVRAADGGTLFLDEIGDLPMTAQASLLRTLESQEVLPVGASQPSRVDLRVVSATNRDPPAMVARGEFRADLWARLSGFVLLLPPLRDRIEDLGLLVASTLRRFAPDRADRLVLSLAAGRELLARRWPLNVRELVNALQRAVAVAAGDTIDVEHLPPATPRPSVEAPEIPSEAPDELLVRDRERRARLEILLEAHAGNVTDVARALGKARPLVHRWLKELGIDPARYRRRPLGR